MKEELLKKLDTELSELREICNKLFSERYTANKHDGRWTDKLYEDYRHTVSRISVLQELLR